MHGLVRCKHERRCSRACGADVSFRDVTIKIPDRGYDQGYEWRHAPEAWVEIWEKSVSWDWDLGEARRIRALRAPSVLGGADGNVVIERSCLSLPYVEKPLNSKVIKSFVPELRSRKCFLRTGMNMFISRIHIWICYTIGKDSIWFFLEGFHFLAMSKSSHVRFRLFVAWNINTVIVFPLIFVFLLLLLCQSMYCLCCFYSL